MARKKTYLILFFLIPFLFFNSLPESSADIQIPLITLPYPNLTLYYLIEGEGVLQSINPLFNMILGQVMTLPIDILKVSFPGYKNQSNNEMVYSLNYFGTSKVINSTLNILTRIAQNGRTCPFYLKYSGLPNIIGLEFDYIFQYGGIKYIQWNNVWIKTILYYFSYQDGSTSYSFRFYYDYTSYVLIQLEEETITNLLQTQYLRYSLIIGNVVLTPENNITGDWSKVTNLIIGIIASVFVSFIMGYSLLKRKRSKN